MARHAHHSSPLLGQCWARTANAGPALNLHLFWCLVYAGHDLDIVPAVARHYTSSRITFCPQQALDVESVLLYCWTNIVDGGPTLNQHCFTVLCPVGHALSPMILYHIARKRETLAWCYCGVGPAFVTLAGIVSVSRVHWVFVFLWTWLHT